MNVKLKKQESNKVVIEIELEFTNSMLESEERIQEALNNAGCLATGSLLEMFDTDGSPIRICNQKLTSKGQEKKQYYTPYGKAEIKRHVYQSNEGGTTYCPLENDARIFNKTTPRFAKIVSHKYANMNGRCVELDLEENHQCTVSLGYIQGIADLISTVANIKKEKWTYAIPELSEPVGCISIGMDGTTGNIVGEGYKEIEVGTISLFNTEGKRIFTKYIAMSPESGKETFKQTLSKEILFVSRLYPGVHIQGLADGSKENWNFLKERTDSQTIDFYHVSEYIVTAGNILFQDEIKRKAWIEEQCHNLKTIRDYPDTFLDLINNHNKELKKRDREKLSPVITYFTNNKDKMNYVDCQENNRPIGSGVTEAACKTVVKQRLCNSGMQWTRHGVKMILTLRTMYLTTGHWKQFWNKVNQYGLGL